MATLREMEQAVWNWSENDEEIKRLVEERKKAEPVFFENGWWTFAYHEGERVSGIRGGYRDKEKAERVYTLEIVDGHIRDIFYEIRDEHRRIAYREEYLGIKGITNREAALTDKLDTYAAKAPLAVLYTITRLCRGMSGFPIGYLHDLINTYTDKIEQKLKS